MAYIHNINVLIRNVCAFSTMICASVARKRGSAKLYISESTVVLSI